MFPLNDFNIVACALATFSAAVGYRVSRGRTRGANGSAQNDRTPGFGRFRFPNLHRRNSTASARSASVATTDCDGTEPPASECGTPYSGELDNSPAEQDSLKRKRSPTPETTEPVAPPLKRRKTPEPEASKETAVLTEEETVCQTLPPTNPDSTLAAPTGAPYDEDCQTGPCEIVQSSTMPEPTEPSLDKEPRSPIGEPPLSHPETASPDTCACGARPPVVLPTPTSSWSSLGTIVAVKPSTAFREFSGTSTAFASVFSAAAQRSPGPVWSMTDGDVTANQTASDPLAAHSYATSTQTIVTGEEDESASTELKGAKVFIKRGDRDFCEGILGHAKLLKHRQTGAERLLFRREPVMKVSVNVRMHPLVRCSFDETQGLLRVTLKEPVEDTQLEHIVVYALKRGKASRAEFAEFAKAVMSSAQSHSRVQDPAPSSTPSYPSEPPAV